MLSFYAPWNYCKAKTFLIFLEFITWEHWPEISEESSVVEPIFNKLAVMHYRLGLLVISQHESCIIKKS